MTRGSQLAPPWAPHSGLLSSLGTLVSPFCLKGVESVPPQGRSGLADGSSSLVLQGYLPVPWVTVTWTPCSFWTISPLLTHWKPSSLEGRWAFARCLAGPKAILHGDLGGRPRFQASPPDLTDSLLELLEHSIHPWAPIYLRISAIHSGFSGLRWGFWLE